MFAPRLSYSYLLGLIGFGIFHVAAQDQDEQLIPVKATYDLAKFPENMQNAFKFGLGYPDIKFPIGCVMVIQHNDDVTWEQLLNAEHYFPFCLPAMEQPLSFQAVSPKTLHDLDVMVLEKPEPQWGQHFYALSGAWPSTGSLLMTSVSEKDGLERLRGDLRNEDLNELAGKFPDPTKIPVGEAFVFDFLATKEQIAAISQ